MMYCDLKLHTYRVVLQVNFVAIGYSWGLKKRTKETEHNCTCKNKKYTSNNFDLPHNVEIRDPATRNVQSHTCEAIYISSNQQSHVYIKNSINSTEKTKYWRMPLGPTSLELFLERESGPTPKEGCVRHITTFEIWKPLLTQVNPTRKGRYGFDIWLEYMLWSDNIQH